MIDYRAPIKMYLRIGDIEFPNEYVFDYEGHALWDDILGIIIPEDKVNNIFTVMLIGP